MRTAVGYNEFLARMGCRLSDSLSEPLTGGLKGFANITRFPFLKLDLPKLTSWLDGFIRTRLLRSGFDPLQDENWRLLCVDAVANHILRKFGRRRPELTHSNVASEAEISHRPLSEVRTITVRESCRVPARKCIYEWLPYPSRPGSTEGRWQPGLPGDGTTAWPANGLPLFSSA